VATQLPQFDDEEQRVRILRAIEETQKFSAEARKLAAEMDKLRGDLKYQPRLVFFQAVLAITAIIGAGLAMAKFFLG
jgi:hypothetical protein